MGANRMHLLPGRTNRAAELNRVQAAEALLDYGIDITIPESNGRTAVHLAARAGHTDMLQTIMVRARKGKGCTAAPAYEASLAEATCL
eukprot:1160570-Pelagomonas_calceolata.AAC.3